jgi:hypothetical protein
MSERHDTISRRRALWFGGGAAVALVGAAVTTDRAQQAAALVGRTKSTAMPAGASGEGRSLPVRQMEQVLRAKGTVTNGVLRVGIDRTDIGAVSLRGVSIHPSFEVNGDLTFQPTGASSAFFNGDLPLKRNEVNPFIDAIIANDLVFQAEHQHFYDFDPEVWFIHWRGTGEPIDLASRVHKCVKATSTPLPQSPPPHPTTPLDKNRLKSILHGFDAEASTDGVVTILVARRNAISISGITVRPEANIATNVAFQPLNRSGSRAAAAPDFAMDPGEITDVMRVMRAAGWDIGCLYNQETDEHPQLFFSHQFKTGDPSELAAEIRRGLDRMNTE